MIFCRTDVRLILQVQHNDVMLMLCRNPLLAVKKYIGVSQY